MKIAQAPTNISLNFGLAWFAHCSRFFGISNLPIAHLYLASASENNKPESLFISTQRFNSE